MASELNGKTVAAKKLAKNKPQYPYSNNSVIAAKDKKSYKLKGER